MDNHNFGEPWTYVAPRKDDEYTYCSDGSPGAIHDYVHGWVDPTEHLERIVLAINAVVGIPNEVLEGLAPGEIAKLLKIIVD